MIRILYHIPLWVLFFIFRTYMILIGWVLIPPSAYFRLYNKRESQAHKGKIITAWTYKFMWPWGNEEDGIYHGLQFKDLSSERLQIVYWSAFRNPANNLRYVKWLGADLSPEKIKYVGSLGSSIESANKYNLVDKPLWFYAWQGAYSNIYVIFFIGKDLYKFRIGWKVHPFYIFGIPPGRKEGTGFGMQFKRISKG